MRVRRGPTLFLALLGMLAFSAGVALANKAASTGTRAPTSGDVRALLIGIGDFSPDGAGASDLSFPDEDVDDVTDALQNEYAIAGNITTVVTKVETAGDADDAERADLLVALAALTTASGSNDDILVYVSGHGTRAFDAGGPGSDNDRERIDNAIVTSDNNVIRDGELADLLASDNAARVIVILDISFPSGFKDDFQRAFSAVSAPELLLIPAAKGEAAEAGVLNNGIFTYWFWNRAGDEIAGLPGPAFANDDADGFQNADDRNQNPHATEDGDVTLEEAFDFVSHVKALSLTQKPNILDLATNDVLLA